MSTPLLDGIRKQAWPAFVEAAIKGTASTAASLGFMYLQTPKPIRAMLKRQLHNPRLYSKLSGSGRSLSSMPTYEKNIFKAFRAGTRRV